MQHVHWLWSDWNRARPLAALAALATLAVGVLGSWCSSQLEEAHYPSKTVKVCGETSEENAAESRSTANPFNRAKETRSVAEHH